MDVELHSGPMADLAPEWTALWRDEHTVFMTSGWAAAWWRHYGVGAQPLSAVVRDGGDVVALAAFAVRRQGPARVLVPVGVDPGDWWDVLARPDVRDAAIGAVARELIRRADAWDAAVLRLLPPGEGLIEALERAGARIAVRRPIPAPAIELPADFDAYLQRLSASRRSNLRRHLKRLDGGEVRLRTVTDASELAAALERWRGFRERQWAAQGREINPDHLSDRFRAFVEDVLRDLIPSGRATLWEFSHDGQVAGSYVNFCDAESYFWFLGGFAPEAQSLGLGKIAIGHGIRTSVEAGRRVYDFARGAEPYKYWYGAEDRFLGGVVAGSSRLRSRAALVAAAVAARRPR